MTQNSSSAAPGTEATPGAVILSERAVAALTPAQRADAAVEHWFADVKASVGPELPTETYNRLFALVPNLKAALAAALA